jgi:hypothetical protein
MRYTSPVKEEAVVLTENFTTSPASALVVQAYPSIAGKSNVEVL